MTESSEKKPLPSPTIADHQRVASHLVKIQEATSKARMAREELDSNPGSRAIWSIYMARVALLRKLRRPADRIAWGEILDMFEWGLWVGLKANWIRPDRGRTVSDGVTAFLVPECLVEHGVLLTTFVEQRLVDTVVSESSITPSIEGDPKRWSDPWYRRAEATPKTDTSSATPPLYHRRLPWVQYLHHVMARPYNTGDDMSVIKVSDHDAELGCPKLGDMVAMNIGTRGNDMWLIEKHFFMQQFREYQSEEDDS